MRVINLDHAKVTYNGRVIGKVLTAKEDDVGVSVTIRVDDPQVRRWLAAGACEISVKV